MECGASGGMAANISSKAGLSVALMEAGGDYDPAKEEYRTQFTSAYQIAIMDTVRSGDLFLAA